LVKQNGDELSTTKQFDLFYTVESNNTFSQDTSKYEKETKIFKDYLQHRFNTFVPKESHNYLLSSDEGCKGCNSFVIRHLDSFNIQTIITSTRGLKEFENVLMMDEFELKKMIRVDSTGSFDRLNLGVRGVAIITTQNHKITKIKSINTATIFPSLHHNGI